jgi:putative addiction module component (TIGR02574 family)
MLRCMAVANKLAEEALALPEKERWDLVSRLVDSFEGEMGDDYRVSSDEEWQAAWKETLERRVRSIDDGSVEMLDGDEFLTEMHALAAAPPSRP